MRTSWGSLSKSSQQLQTKTHNTSTLEVANRDVPTKSCSRVDAPLPTKSTDGRKALDELGGTGGIERIGRCTRAHTSTNRATLPRSERCVVSEDNDGRSSFWGVGILLPNSAESRLLRSRKTIHLLKANGSRSGPLLLLSPVTKARCFVLGLWSMGQVEKPLAVSKRTQLPLTRIGVELLGQTLQSLILQRRRHLA
ncbi:hypothetical protein GWK47_048878 [Chionoecetes opilio]|uniref:Uncharacterized protein n=1 Tax=Chionoecetes opilio TaxID=41210 RepID=A0A8J4YAN4_CHIOP|nr:hypothetical protein GWK47_048878 [Chionoecetes opilio]